MFEKFIIGLMIVVWVVFLAVDVLYEVRYFDLEETDETEPDESDREESKQL